MKKYLILLVGLILLSSQAFATPMSTTNLTAFLGTTLTENTAFESNERMYLLNEKTNYTVVGSGLKVDLNAPGTYTGNALNTDPGAINPKYLPGQFSISAGTAINSYFIHFNPLDAAVGAPPVNVKSSLKFGPTETILGIMTSIPSLDASDPLVGLPGITYNSYPLGGFGLDKNDDVLKWILNLDGTSTLELDLFVGRNALDEVRVITTAATAPVPEPATMFLLGSGLIGVGAFVRRKFKK